MKKILYYLLALLLTVVVISVSFFDQFAKIAMEFYGQRAFNSPISIAEFRSDWSQKRINIDFIEVKNPPNFVNENAFVLNHLSASLSNQTQGNLIVLEQLEFDGLLFTLEQNARKVNLVELLKQLDRQSSNNTKQRFEDQKHKNTHRVKIKQLSFIDTQLFIDTQWFKKTITVPDVIIYNFGNDNGIPINQIGSEIMKVVLTRIQAEVERNGLKLSEDKIKESVRRQLRVKIDDLTEGLDNKAKKWLQKLGP